MINKECHEIHQLLTEWGGASLIIDRVGGASLIIDRVGGASLIIDTVGGASSIIDRVGGASLIIDTVEASLIIDRVEGGASSVIDRVEGGASPRQDPAFVFPLCFSPLSPHPSPPALPASDSRAHGSVCRQLS